MTVDKFKYLALALSLVFGRGEAAVTPSGGGASETPTAQVVAASAHVHEPWDGRVDVDYTVYLPVSGTEAEIAVTAADATCARAYTAATLDGTTRVSTSGVYRVTWNLAADYPDIYEPALCVTVAASVSAFTPDETSGNYLVVDLSGGADAAHYGVSYLMDAPADGWSDDYKTSKLVLRKIPAGSFTMGMRETDYPEAADQNLHEVVLTKAAWAGVFEITQRQWELVMGTRPSFFRNDECYATRPVEKVNYNAICGTQEGSQWPASAGVDADSFLGLLRARTCNETFDLPTEAQWEYACRAGTTTALNSNCDLSNARADAALDALACYNRAGTASSGLDKGTMPVGSRTPNNWGLYDMHGNVSEWTRDWYQTSLEAATATNPAGPAAVTGGTHGLRGGNWNGEAYTCMSSYRGLRAAANVTSGSGAYGFRVFAAVSAQETWQGPTAGSGVAEPVSYDGRIVVTLNDALDNPGLVFTTGGDNAAEWVATNAPVKIGTHAAQCLSPGTASRKEKTRSVWMETTVTGAGTLTFWWKVDCDWDDSGECAWDHLAYFVDGVEQARIDGDTDWTFCTVALADEGPHAIRWVYEKDQYQDERDCADVGWVDAVVWTPAGSGDEDTIAATIGSDGEGRLQIGWSPRLDEAETARRTYTLLAKRELDDASWVPVAVSADGTFFTAPAEYRFFKVSVRRK